MERKSEQLRNIGLVAHVGSGKTSLAEAMLLSKPVIATNYSGNTDFMNENNSFLVDYELISVTEGSYPCSEGQVWAEPNIISAANHMNNIITDPMRATQIPKNAHDEIRKNLSFISVGNLIRNRLLVI